VNDFPTSRAGNGVSYPTTSLIGYRKEDFGKVALPTFLTETVIYNSLFSTNTSSGTVLIYFTNSTL